MNIKKLLTLIALAIGFGVTQLPAAIADESVTVSSTVDGETVSITLNPHEAVDQYTWDAGEELAELDSDVVLRNISKNDVSIEGNTITVKNLKADREVSIENIKTTAHVNSEDTEGFLAMVKIFMWSMVILIVFCAFLAVIN